MMLEKKRFTPGQEMGAFTGALISRIHLLGLDFLTRNLKEGVLYPEELSIRQMSFRINGKSRQRLSLSR